METTQDRIKEFLTSTYTLKGLNKERNEIASEVTKITIKEYPEKVLYTMYYTIFENDKEILKDKLDFDFPTSQYAYKAHKTQITIARIHKIVNVYKDGVSANTIYINFEKNEISFGNFLVFTDIEQGIEIIDKRKITDEQFQLYVERRLKLINREEYKNIYNQRRWDALPKMSKEWVLDEINNLKVNPRTVAKLNYLLKRDDVPNRINKAFLMAMKAVYDQKRDEITPLDVFFIDFDEELLKYLKKNLLTIKIRNLDMLVSKKNLYGTLIQTYIRKYLAGQQGTMRNMQQTQDTNPISEITQGRRVYFVNKDSIDEKIPVNINNMMGVIDPIFSSEQQSNVTNRFTNAISFKDGEMYIKVYTPKFEEKEIPIAEYMNNPILTYENIDYRTLTVKKNKDDAYQCYLYGDYVVRHLKDIKYYRHMDSLVSPATARLFGINKTYVGRGLYAGLHQTQNVTTVGATRTMIDTGSDTYAYDNTLSHIRAEYDGIIVGYEDHIVIIQTKDGDRIAQKVKDDYVESTNHSFMHYVPRFKIGDVVKKNDVLFSYNTFDDKGGLKMSVPALVMVGTYHSMENNDSFVISKSFAEKLGCEEEEHIDIVLYPDKYELQINDITSDVYEKIGLPKIGDTVIRDDILFKYGIKIDTDEGNVYKALRGRDLIKPKVYFVPYAIQSGTIRKIEIFKMSKNYSEKYEKYLKAIEDDCYRAQKAYFGKKFDEEKEQFEDLDAECVIRIKIAYVRMPTSGLKIAMHNGNKGTISKILNDDMMPRTKDNRRIDLIISSLAMVPRMLGGQAYMLYLGKLAVKLYERIKKDEIDDNMLLALKFLFPKERVINPQSILKKYGYEWGNSGFLRFQFAPYDNSINEDDLVMLQELTKIPAREYLWDAIDNVWIRNKVEVGYGDVSVLYMMASKKFKVTPTKLYTPTTSGYGAIRGLKHGQQAKQYGAGGYSYDYEKEGQSMSETINALASHGAVEEYKTLLRDRGINPTPEIVSSFDQMMLRLTTNFSQENTDNVDFLSLINR